MAWQKLKKHLQQMPETGSNGFEGLATKLLELALGESFVVARTGDQPSGDAHNLKRNVCLQAKRYADAVPNAKNLEGDFDQSLRSLPETDVYILAITKSTAQLDDTLNAMRDKSGVDVVIWEFDGEASSLATLCIEFWDQLHSFECIRSIDSELKPWVSIVKATLDHQNRVKKLLNDLRECTQTFAEVKTRANSFLERRFNPAKAAGAVFSFPIDLGKAVQRTSYADKVLKWWEAAKERVVVIRGEEGMGKTWLAAQCVQTVRQQNEVLILWLESMQWRNCQTFEQALIEAISRLQMGEANKTARLVRKVRNQWSKKTLLVLDGVNEQEALKPAQRILDDLISKEMGGCRILFTTRPLASVTGFEDSLWKKWPELPVERFNDDEFKAALSSFDLSIGIVDVPEQLASFARIPRYFQTCIKLRDKLKSFGNISLPLVLWTDLLEKINGVEPQIRAMLGWKDQRDAIDVLVELAKNSPNGGQGIAQEILNRCFNGKYAEVRHYLKEIRILKDIGLLEAELTSEHTVLGKGLFLKALSLSLLDKSISEISDRLKKELEPLAGEDGSTEALFVALQLSALQDTDKSPATSKSRAAFLHAWIFSHNSQPTEERLNFWSEKDISAYAKFVEAFFEKHYGGDAQYFLVRPLAVQWKKDGPQAEELKQYLHHWLLLLWFNNVPDSIYEYEGYQLPVASTPDQVRLTAVALSILSLRPDNNFLKNLALCHATDSLTWQIFKGPNGTEHKHPFKSVQGNIGILMRWGYTEQVVPLLEQLAQNNQNDKLLLKGLRWLAYILRIVEVPAILKLSEDELPKPFYLGCPAAELIRERRHLFAPKVEGQAFLAERDFGYLAVRTDLPSLADEDISKIVDAVEKMCVDEATLKGNGYALKDHDFEAWWPWYAKFNPQKTATLAGELSYNGLTQPQPYTLFRLIQSIPLQIAPDKIGDWVKLARAKFSDEAKSFRDIDHLASVVSEMVLLSMPEEIVDEWIVSAANHGSLRTSMFFCPITRLIPYLIPEKTGQYAIRKCLEMEDKIFGPIDGPPTEFEYWCYIASLVAKPSAEIFEWSKQLLLQSKPGNERNFSLLRLWFRSAPAGYVERAINDKGTENLFDMQAMRAWAHSEGVPFDAKAVHASYGDLIKRCPKGFAGHIFSESKRDTDLKRWGDELFGLAINCIGKAPIKRQSRAQTRLVLGSNQEVDWIAFQFDDSSPRSGTSNVSSWGINQGRLETFLGGQKDWEKVFNEEFEKWKSDEHALQNWEESDLHFFGAWGTLEVYRQLNQEQFSEKSHLLLRRALGSSDLQFHIGGFLHVIIATLLPDEPRAAWEYFLKLNSGGLGIHVSMNFDIPLFYYRLWNLNLCASTEHKQLRLHLFEQSQNEFEIMILAVAAIANDAQSELYEIADEFLKNPFAKNRSLAVSILAWMGEDKSNQILKKLMADDPSEWIRRHAKWSSEVGLQEKDARGHFEKSLKIADPVLISASLQVLEPALTPVARWWLEHIRREAEKKGLVLKGKVAGVIESFIHHWTSVHSSSVSAAGRKLDEYCRGERLDKLKTMRIAPWWNL